MHQWVEAARRKLTHTREDTLHADLAVSTVYQCRVERLSHGTQVNQLADLPKLCTDEEDGDTNREDCLLSRARWYLTIVCYSSSLFFSSLRYWMWPFAGRF